MSDWETEPGDILADLERFYSERWLTDAVRSDRALRHFFAELVKRGGMSAEQAEAELRLNGIRVPIYGPHEVPR